MPEWISFVWILESMQKLNPIILFLWTHFLLKLLYSLSSSADWLRFQLQFPLKVSCDENLFLDRIYSLFQMQTLTRHIGLDFLCWQVLNLVPFGVFNPYLRCINPRTKVPSAGISWRFRGAGEIISG